MMDFHVYLHHRHDDEKLDEILRLLRIDILEGRSMATDFEQALDELAARAQQTTDAEDSIILVLNGIAEALKNAPVPAAATQALKDIAAKLSGGVQKLTDAALANTPAAATPTTPSAPPFLP